MIRKFAHHRRGQPEQVEETIIYDHLLGSPPSLIAVDVETISLEVPVLVGISVAISPDESFYFPVLPEPSIYLGDIIAILQNSDIVKVMHNSLFDLAALAEFTVDRDNIIDTLLMAHLVGERFADLRTLSANIGFFLPEFPKIKEWIWDLSEEQIATKCCTDAEATFALYLHYEDKVDWDYLRTEMKLIPILLTMSSKGLKVDQNLRASIEIELAADLEAYLSVAEDLGFNPASPKQTAYMLAKDGVFLPMTKSRKSLGTNERILSKINHPIAGFVLAYRECNKLHSTYIKPLKGEERCYTKFHLDAITGRVSSSKHNLQNIPKGRMRNIFLPDSAPWTDIDFSQIELRTLAYITQDDVMQAVFDSDGDMHQTTADSLQIPRYPAKTGNFAMIYGATDETLMEAMSVSKQQAREFRVGWYMLYPKAGAWIEQQQFEAPAAGYIKTLYGRKIPLPVGVENLEKLKRKSINYPIQASAAEIVKRAMIRCAEEGLLGQMRLQVHDELLFDGDVSEKLATLELNHIAPFETPYSIKLLERWE